MSLFKVELNAAKARHLSTQGLARMKADELDGALRSIERETQWNSVSTEHTFIEHFDETIAELTRRGFKMERLDENQWPTGTRYRISWGTKKERRQPPEPFACGV